MSECPDRLAKTSLLPRSRLRGIRSFANSSTIPTRIAVGYLVPRVDVDEEPTTVGFEYRAPWGTWDFMTRSSRGRRTKMRLTTRGVRITVLGRGVVVRVFVTVQPPDVDPAPRRRPSEKVRVAGARVRVSSDNQVHRRSPHWITALANSDVTDASVGRRQGDKCSTGRFGWWRRQ